ncbi:MAG: hypothetical protein HY645_06925 [Acidobacteria bacterium]|nr:hypothetical protein [Acidobacteriota bacterium]
MVQAKVLHQGRQIENLDLSYAGQTNVFAARFNVPVVAKDYEVLDVVVTASQSDAPNYGVHRRTFKLTPG